MNKKNSALLIVCAAVTLLCVLLLCTDFFGLRGEDKAANGPTAAPTAASSRYSESAEYHAARDWLDFTSAYDPDGSILQSAVAEGGTDYAGDYTMYRVYSQDLAGKLEEIVEHYALSLHRSMSFCYGGDELCRAAGLENFLPANCECAGYIYDNGSFHFEGSALLDGTPVAYQFDRQMKGVFSETALNFPGEGESATAVTSDGVRLHLTVGGERSLIHAELPLSYVTITVPLGAKTGTNPGGVTEDWLKELGGSFLWSRIG